MSSIGGYFQEGFLLGVGDIYRILRYSIESVSAKTEEVSHFYPKLLKDYLHNPLDFHL